MTAYGRVGLHTDPHISFDFFVLAVLAGEGIVSAAHIVLEGTISSYISSHTGLPGATLGGGP